MSSFSGNSFPDKRAYWAVQVSEAADDPARLYLCHAPHAAAAKAIAARLAGGTGKGRSFEHFWIDPARLERRASRLPPLGDHLAVGGPAEWALLIREHKASKVALEAQPNVTFTAPKDPTS